MTKTTQNYSNSGCFSGIFRRMLCTGSVPTHPSSSPKIPHYSKTITKFNDDNNIPHNNKRHTSENPEPEPKPGPNLVARLMGLDSLPPSANLPPKSSSPDSFSRSRSVNFADYLLNFDAENDNNSRSHRRVRTSVSFREVPGGVSFKPPSGEFVVVYLESNNKPEKEKKKSNNTERLCAKTKNDNDDKASKLIKNEPRRKVLAKASSSTTDCKVKNGGSNVKSRVLKRENNEKKVTEKFARKRKSNRGSKRVRLIESNTQKLSVSVLKDCSDEHSRAVNPELKTKTKSREQKVAYHLGNGEFELRSIKNKNNGNLTDNKDALDFTELAKLLLKLTEQDLSESYWFSNTKNTTSDFEDICVVFEELILDVLLNDLASEIVHI